MFAKNINSHVKSGWRLYQGGLADLDPPCTKTGEDGCSTGQSDLFRQRLGFKKGMAIASLNVNGLRSHLDEVQLLMNNLGIHILALNENKLDPNHPKELISVAGYQQERFDRTCNGGGVSIYIRDSIKYKPHSDVPVDDLEIICFEVEPPKSKSFLVLVWYRPPSDPVVSFDKLERFSLSWTKRV